MNEELDDILHREQLVIAPVSKRSSAFMIDELLLSTLLIIILWDAFTAAQTIEEVIYLTNQFVLEFMAIKIAYQTFFVYQYGATLGKIVMKIKVLELSSLSSPTLQASFNRAIFRVISEMILYLGFLWGILDPYKRTWHDRTAKTIVVN